MRGPAGAKPPIRVVAVDDHPIVLAGARALIGATTDIVCVGTASTGSEALALLEREPCDVVVVDVTLPDMNGLALAAEITRRGLPARPLLLTSDGDRGLVQRALQAGAKGFVEKRSSGENLLLAIRTLMLGGLFLDSYSALEMAVGSEPGPTETQLGTVGLTPRELDVLRLVALGHSNKEIAAQFDLSVKSVETYRARATEKLSLHSRAQIVRFALSQGWLSGD
ncbi:response regulator transcription factor [Prosthecomicrobium sp. N25]|uniref:response regulator transcription factor n=1 Tax=Prosthecomicrobium sp. N25 TaxID=3129254 RepID=UPI003077646E